MPARDLENLLVLVAADSHVGVCRTLENIRLDAGGPAALAVARGTLAGIAEWLTLTHGRKAAYEILQTEADELINRGGHDNAGTPSSSNEGKDA